MQENKERMLKKKKLTVVMTLDVKKKSGKTITWQETVDHDGNIRQVRPSVRPGKGKEHYTFDKDGNYTGKW